MNKGHLIGIFAVALVAALAAALGIWYLRAEEETAASGDARIAVEESVDILVGQSTVISPVLIDGEGGIHSDAVFEFSCADEEGGAYLKFDNVQQGRITAVSYTEQPLAVRIVNQAYGVQAEVQVHIQDVLGEVLSVQCAAGSVRYGEDVVLRAEVLPRGCDLSDNLGFTVITTAGEEIPVEEAFSDIAVTRSEGTSYSHVITLRGCAVGSGTLGLSVSYDGSEEEAYGGSFGFDISLEDGAIGRALSSAADTDGDGFASHSELSAVRSLTVSGAADFSVLDLFPSVVEVYLPADALTDAYGLPASEAVRFYVPSGQLSAYLEDSAWSAAEESIFPQEAAEEGAVIAVLHSAYGTPLAWVDLSSEVLPVYSHTGYTHIGWSMQEGGEPADEADIQDSVHLYAIWEANTYTVTFDYGEGKGDVQSKQVIYDAPYGVLPEATLAGYRGIWTLDGEDITADTVVHTASDHTLTARYLGEYFSVTFVYPDGSLGQGVVQHGGVYGALPQGDGRPGYTLRWYTEESGGEEVSAETAVSAIADHSLYGRYVANTYTLTYHANGGTGAMDAQTFVYDEAQALYANVFTRTGYTFAGWSRTAGGAAEFTEGEEVSNLTAFPNGNVTLYAVWSANPYTVYFEYGDGSGELASMPVKYDSPYGDLPAANKTGYSYTWMTEDGTEITAESIVTTASDHWLVAVYTIKTFSYTLGSHPNVSITVTNVDTGEIIEEGEPIPYGTRVNITATANSNYKDAWSDPSGTLPVTENFTITGGATKKECVATGTLITLADGSQVPVEQLTGEELLLVWNLETGSFDAAPVLFMYSDLRAEYEVIRLVFSDGTEVKVIGEHAFWDIDLNKYVYGSSGEDFSAYIGHRFYKQSSAGGGLVQYAVTLTDVVVGYEVTEAWSPVTYKYLCFYVDGMLSMPGSTKGLINIFDVDAQIMRYDEAAMRADIERYGLFTYEDFADIISEPVFEAFNVAYLKVSMGKGLITWEDIFSLVARFSEYFDQIE